MSLFLMDCDVKMSKKGIGVDRTHTDTVQFLERGLSTRIMVSRSSNVVTFQVDLRVRCIDQAGTEKSARRTMLSKESEYDDQSRRTTAVCKSTTQGTESTAFS
jgi:hypothetical protein